MDPVKRKNIEATSSSSKHIRLDETAGLDSGLADGAKSDYSFDDLPAEIIRRIFSYIPGRYWPRLELVNHHFQSGILGTWNDLKTVRLEQFVDDEPTYAKGAVRRRILLSLLGMLYVRSPTVESVSGFGAVLQSLDIGSLRQLSQFGTLKSVGFVQCQVNARHLAEFLATSSSRSCLEELRICAALDHHETGADRALHEAVIDKPGRPSLKLRRLVYTGNKGSWDEFITGLDVSRLESLSVAGDGVRMNCGFSLDCLAKLLGRCTQLQELRWSSYKHENRYAYLDCLASLTSTKLRKLELYEFPFGNYPTVAKVLERIAPICQGLDKLVIRGDLTESGALINVLCENFQSLSTLHLNVGFCDAASLTELATRMDRMKRLALYGKDGQINSDVLKAIGSHMKGLESLCLTGLVVSDGSKILSELEQLNELSMTGPDIPNPVVIEWCNTLGPRLEMLELSSLTINDSSIAICAKDLGRVRRLSLRRTRITDASLHALTNCDRLERLDLSYCKGITQAGVHAVIDGCKMLVHLELIKTPITKMDTTYDQRSNALTIYLKDKTKGVQPFQ